jgi:hypothetical protein
MHTHEHTDVIFLYVSTDAQRMHINALTPFHLVTKKFHYIIIPSLGDVYQSKPISSNWRAAVNILKNKLGQLTNFGPQA